MPLVALVTGAGSGIGRETALAFARSGARVVVADWAVPMGEETAHLIHQLGGEVIFVRTDVTLAAQVEAMVQRGIDEFGAIDCAFNNAGVAIRDGGSVAEFPEDEWDRLIGINLKGVWLCLKYECRHMVSRNRGAIVNASSIMGRVSSPAHSAYSAAKAGVIGMTQSAALDYAAQGIRVNAICPGGIRTPMTANPDMQARLIERTPMARLGEAREIADTVVWLCSEQASFITGQAIVVDGGYTVR